MKQVWNHSLSIGLAVCALAVSAQCVTACGGGAAGDADSGATAENDAASTTADGTTGGDTTAAGKSEIILTTGNSTIRDGGKFWTPLDNGTSDLNLFTEQKDIWTLRNNTAADIKVDSITTKPDAGVQTEEFQIYDNLIPSKAATLANITVAAGKTYEFQIRFYPVASGERKATVTVAYDGTKKLAFALTGKGQTKAKFFSSGTVAWEKVGGTTKGDDLTNTGVTNADGVTFWSTNSWEMLDGFSSDFVVGAVDKDGKALWTKSYDGQYKEQSPDSGQNNETGGTGGSTVLGADGSLYVAGEIAAVSQNNVFYASVFKIDPKTGTMIWQRAFSPVKAVSTASHSAAAYAIDASGPQIFIAGVTEGDAKVLLAALDPKTGDLQGALSLELVKQYNDRAYCLRRDGKGGLYIGGIAAGNNAFILHFKNADTAKPELEWSKQIGLGKGSGLTDMDVDADGNAYVAMDVRGAATSFMLGKVDLTGKLVWTKHWVGNGGDRENIAFVRVFGTTVIAGGRMGVPTYDTAQGDGALLGLATSDGAKLWSALHYSGKGPDEISEHRVKGASLIGKTLTLITQVYTGKDNGVRYSGYWYDGEGDVVDEKTLDATALDGIVVETIKDAKVFDSKDLGKWVDVPKAWVWQDATAKHDGKSPDADVMVTRIDLK